MEIKKQTLKETWQQDKLSFFLLGGTIASLAYLISIVGSAGLNAYKEYTESRIPQRTLSYLTSSNAPSKNKLYHGSPEEIWEKMHNNYSTIITNDYNKNR